MKLLDGKTIVIMGVANERSLAWSIAKLANEAGANLIFTYRKERSLRKLSQLLEEHGISPLLTVCCDADDDESIRQAFAEIKDSAGMIHGLVHSIAFANKEELQGEYVNTSREGYLLAQSSSAYSLVAVAREAKALMPEGGSIVTQSYIGAERVVPNYNVMGVAKAALEASVKYLAEDLGRYGIRVNAVSSGPVRTLAAKGVSGFNEIFKTMEAKTPLRRNIEQEEVGDVTLFLLSRMSRGVTGEIIHVDAGYHIMGI
ncbi:enoyl-ACP reductase FabI [Paenibacillus sp. J2TS4]|uniref:enoyl-ACP reductase FabI n=1 Tax=Paenibacillus sp. J2TS4 TaxID=2807194 RepID=UPI001B0B5AC8|nr:enoyl-ACP reductase FabI [Paenibacillus sp. J2TS4]GIP33269.1 enoyl-[acyl-carrier-protein] reductase [NADH] [Paenibacillus sp. J2TS4]